MLNKLSLCALLFSLFAIVGFAQTSSGDYHKFEAFGGYSNNQVDTNSGSTNNTDSNNYRRSSNGFEVSATGNFSRFFGIKGDFSAHYRKYSFSIPANSISAAQNLRLKSTIYNFLGGVQIKDNAKNGSRFRPFGYAMVGAARATGEDLDSGASGSENGLAGAFGGGIDIKATRRLSVRAVQVDYNPTHFADAVQHNFRIGVGLVIH